MDTPEDKNDNEVEVIIITGLSGSGISTAIQVFEDMNFFTADGLPPSVIPEFIALAHKPEMQHFRGIVLGLDLKRKYLNDPLAELLPVFTKIRQTDDTKATLIYLEADKDSILRRYASTRRPHPLEQEGYSLEMAMEEEKTVLPAYGPWPVISSTPRATPYTILGAISKSTFPKPWKTVIPCGSPS